MSESFIDILTTVVLCGIFAGTVPLTVRLWHDNLPGIETPMWSWSRTTPARERAHWRALPTLVAGLGLLAVGFASDLVVPGDTGRWMKLVAFGVMLFVVIPTSVLITWFNRPKALVPPHMRQERGYLKVRRTR